MELTIALEQRFYRTPDGRYWTGSLYPCSFWSRYLAVFDGVRVLARVHEASSVTENWKRVDGAGVSIAAVPAYVGPWDFVCNLRHVRKAVAHALRDNSAVLLRIPGLVATLALSAIETGRPFGVEVVSDPYDGFSPGANSHPLRPFFRRWCSDTLKRQCRRAACSLYVTQQALQRRYPPAARRVQCVPERYGEKLSFSVSDVELCDEAFAEQDELLQSSLSPANTDRTGRIRIAFVGMLEVRYKGLDILIGALAQCVQAGLDAELTIVGSGRQMSVFDSLARSLGVSDRLKFLGALPAGEAIRGQLDASDLFILPSRVEGLPRALLEAMARGLPCIGTRVGGVPELLPDDAIVAPGNVAELAAKILEFAESPRRRAEMGKRNLAVSRNYHQDFLQPKRTAFYKCLRDLTIAWQHEGAGLRFGAQGVQPRLRIE